jgi:AcrR family transcriptional regulator
MKKAPATADCCPATGKKPRGRPRCFDREAALEAAMEVFWAKGFEGATLSDLTQAMGINPPSLYAAFGDKEKLFLTALERYTAARGDSCPYCEEQTARAAIARLLTYMAHELTEKCHPRGCLMMMAAATSANASDTLQHALAEARAAGRERMRARIRKGVQEGDVPQGTDVSALADFYSTIIAGMSQQARDGATRRSLLTTVERAMSAFPEAPEKARRAAVRVAAHAQ